MQLFRTPGEKEILERLTPKPPPMDAEQIRKADNAAARMVLIPGVFLRFCVFFICLISGGGHSSIAPPDDWVLISFGAVDVFVLYYLLRRRLAKKPLPKAAVVMWVIPLAFDFLFLVFSGIGLKLCLKLLG